MIAVGEIGLDYHWDTPRGVQKLWFGRQLALASERDLPVIIHSREAAADTLGQLREAQDRAAAEGKRLTGVVHCFSYGPEMAAEYVKMGFWIGIGGVVTFKSARKVKEVVQKIPLEKLVLETDCPYLAPEPFRGKRNDSRLRRKLPGSEASRRRRLCGQLRGTPGNCIGWIDFCRGRRYNPIFDSSEKIKSL